MTRIKTHDELQNPFMHSELINAGFRHHTMVTEDEFKYEYWDHRVLECCFEVTNVYHLNGEFSSQEYMINNHNVKPTARLFDELFSRLYELHQEYAGFFECIGCSGFFDLDIMREDDAGELYCKACWKELAPIMRLEYEKMKRNGEIEDDE